jgi:lysophospholipase L1-like esterase
MLRVRGVTLEPPRIIARTAWTTDELSDAIDADPPSGRYDLVSLLVGVNDQYRSRPVAAFAPEFEQLLRRAKGFAGGSAKRVIAISIPDWGATPFAEGRDRALIGRQIDEYNARGSELAAAAGIRWIDVTRVSRAMQFDPALVTADKLHPSGAMYRLWGLEILPHALTALGE